MDHQEGIPEKVHILIMQEILKVDLVYVDWAIIEDIINIENKVRAILEASKNYHQEQYGVLSIRLTHYS